MSEQQHQPIAAAAGNLPRGRGLKVRMSDRRSPGPVMPEELTAAIALMQSFQGQIVHKLEAQHESSALFSGTVKVRSTGHFTRGWQVQYRAVAVANLSPAPVTIATGGPTGDTAPGEGPGIHVLLPGMAAVLAMSGNALTVYGRPGDLVDLQVFTRAMPPAHSYIGTGGATPTAAYTYDGAGNVTAETHAGMTTSYTYSGSNITGVA